MPEDDAAHTEDAELLVLQHDARAGLSSLEPLLEGRVESQPYRVVDLGAGEAVPYLVDVAGVLVLGGPMGVDDVDAHPWLIEEVGLLREANAREIPVLGICLGAQLIASALGGRVTRRDEPEAGYKPLTRTTGAQDDEVFAGWPDGAFQLFLHRDEVTKLPDGAVRMLEGSDGVAAWRLGTHVHAVQFHPEVGAEQLAQWAESEDLADLFEAVESSADDLIEEAERREKFVRAAGVSMVGRWLDGVVRA